MLTSLKALEDFVSSAKRLAVVGVGSELRGDDVAGIIAAMLLEKLVNDNFHIFLGYTAPENFTGEIKKFMPSHVLIIDAAELGLKPGEIKTFDENQISGITFSTHKMPLKLMIQYLKASFDFSSMFVGIQPGSVAFGTEASEEVTYAAHKVAAAIIESQKKRVIEY